MKFSAALLLAIPAVTSAFSPSSHQQQTRAFVTKVQAKPAASKEEDLELTRKVIAEFNGGLSGGSAPEPAKKEEKTDAKAEKKESK
eukprot:CAMPEP_0119567106 /NCGR_PEP_ID=MMETSP1352-20130426/34999_1 /TAXON_ID=265584 /ORGANISM="Stauroneis constricta, Strain CCMP1120" /LENGTH=85 /DNA_ID=CAMNT_0007616311 /DNA_START=30 /DNA_END=287 /DNA_ORIENTATION=+